MYITHLSHFEGNEAYERWKRTFPSFPLTLQNEKFDEKEASRIFLQFRIFIAI